MFVVGQVQPTEDVRLEYSRAVTKPVSTVLFMSKESPCPSGETTSSLSSNLANIILDDENALNLVEYSEGCKNDNYLKNFNYELKGSDPSYTSSMSTYKNICEFGVDESAQSSTDDVDMYFVSYLTNIMFVFLVKNTVVTSRLLILQVIFDRDVIFTFYILLEGIDGFSIAEMEDEEDSFCIPSKSDEVGDGAEHNVIDRVYI